MEFILASVSPRRIQILRDWGVDFEVRPALIDEEALATRLACTKPELLAVELAKAKSLNPPQSSFAKEEDNSFVIGADTLVALDDEIIGKPKDEQDAYRILIKLADREQIVYTGLAIAQGGNILASGLCSSVVKMKKLDDDMIWHYIREEKPFDKAGAYAIQEGARNFVEYYEGCFNNIVGMPLCTLRALVLENNLALDLPKELPEECEDRGRVYL